MSGRRYRVAVTVQRVSYYNAIVTADSSTEAREIVDRMIDESGVETFQEVDTETTNISIDEAYLESVESAEVVS